MILHEHGVVVEQATVIRGGRAAVADVSMEIAPGQALALIGRTGAGKSSLLAALATALPVAVGDIRVDGHSVRSAADAVRMRVGYVPAGITTWPHARADEFLELFAVQAGLRGKPLRTAVGRGLALAGIARPATPVDTLAAGQAQRLLVARGLLHDPQVLLADAPFNGLDPGERIDLERLFTDMHLGGRIIVAAIDAADVPTCFTHLAVLDSGHLAASGPLVPAAFDAGRTWRYRVVCPGAAAAAVTVLRRRGIDAADLDADILGCRVDASLVACGDVVAALAQAGIPVESAGFHPPWTAQLIDDGSAAAV